MPVPTPDTVPDDLTGGRVRRRTPGRGATTLLACGVAAATVVLASGGSAAAAKTRTTCATEKGTTVEATASARIYRRGAEDDATYYGCWLKTHRRTTLGVALNVSENDASATFSPVAGRYVAVAENATSGETSTALATLVDLKAGKVLRKAVPVVDQDSPDAALTSAVATTDGSLVWAGQAKDCADVHAVTSAGPRTLECGAPSDLVATGTRVYWTQDGQPRSAVPSKP
jgi:hypothetical protein